MEPFMGSSGQPFAPLNSASVPRDPITLELPSGFNVSPEQPHRFHIFFSDRQTREELEGPLLAMHQAWRQYWISQQQASRTASWSPGMTWERFKADLYDSDFARNSREHHEAWDVLSRRNYWEAGPYRVRFVVKTSAPNKEYVAEWRFSLTDQDFEGLRLNAVNTLREICVGQGTYHFAFPDFS